MNALQKIRILLVDDHFFVRIGLRALLEQEADMEVVGEAGNAREGLVAFRDFRPDVTLMDGRLPDFHGCEATAYLTGNFPQARVVLLSIDEGEENIQRAVEAGVFGYLPKCVSRDELLKTIRQVANGRHYFPERIAARLAARNSREPLSAREISVLRYVMKGYINKQIAAELDIVESTVKAHMGHIMVKLGVPDRTRAVAVAIERGIFSLE